MSISGQCFSNLLTNSMVIESKLKPVSFEKVRAAVRESDARTYLKQKAKEQGEGFSERLRMRSPNLIDGCSQAHRRLSRARFDLRRNILSTGLFLFRGRKKYFDNRALYCTIIILFLLLKSL